MVLPRAIPSRYELTRLLSRHVDDHIAITDIVPIDHEVYGKTVYRCTLDRPLSDGADTVIVKRRRDPGEFRAEPEMVWNEVAALQFLANIGCDLAPYPLAFDDDRGILILEDLGQGDSLEDELFRNDPEAATAALVLFATSLGDLHAATAGRVHEYQGLRRTFGPEIMTFDQAQDSETRWHEARAIMAGFPELPQPIGVEDDVALLIATLRNPGPYLILSNGDVCPANTRIGNGRLRFLDFEHASYHHALLDLTSLHIPFPACPCWSLIPSNVSELAISAYRRTYSRCHPGMLDDDEYFRHVAAACLFWAIQRLGKLSQLDQCDEPHPIGFSRRGQRLATIDAAVTVTNRSHSFSKLANWLAELAEALTERWSDAPMLRTTYPAFR